MNLLRRQLRVIIFGTNTFAGKAFDIGLLFVIVASVLSVIFESVPEFGNANKVLFNRLEWIFTTLFAVEFLIRLWVSDKPLKYVFSFWGTIDFFSFAPTFLGLLFSGMNYLIVIRLFRLLRVFRILKLSRYLNESVSLVTALKNSMRKILIFLLFLLLIVVIMGTSMYVIEGEEAGFRGIPDGIYWAIVTITTVGYGDITPQTSLGKIISSFSMLIGYAIIAIPTGIVSVEVERASENKKARSCNRCKEQVGLNDNYCKKCGEALN